MSTTPPTTTAGSRPPVPARVWWVPVVVIVAAAVIGAGVVLSVWDQLPDPVARHWGPDGKPDGWGSKSGQLVFMVLFSTLLPLGMVGLGAALRQPRALGPLAAGMGVFLSVLFSVVLHSQRGLTDAREADDVSGPIWAATGAAFGVGLLVWIAVRDTTRHVASRGPSAAAPRVDVAPGTRLVWSGTTRLGTGTWVGFSLGLLPTLGIAALFFALGNPSLGAFMLVLSLGLVVPLSMLWCTVTIDAGGLRARGFGGIPWVTVPLESVVEARTVEKVSCLGEFGGWGYRGKNDGSGAWGLVTADGPALVVERAGKGDLYVTIDHPDEAAAVLNTLVTRRDGRPVA